MKLRVSLLLALAVALPACSSTKEPPKPCPQIAIVRLLDRLEDYGQDAADDARLVGVGAMPRYDNGKCEYEDDGVEVTFNLSLVAEKGPGLGSKRLGFPYFVSLVDPDNKVIGKEMMMAEFTFEDDKKPAFISQPVRVFIPLEAGKDAAGYRVLSGFQLTETQIKARQAKESPKIAK